MLFSPEEYLDRQSRLRRELEAARLDALLVSGDDNIIYFSGIRSLLPRLIQTRPLFVLIPVSREPAVLIHISRVSDTRVNSPIADVRTYTTTEEVPYGCAPVTALENLLRERGLERSRIGVELGHDTRMGMPVGDFERLKARLPKAQFCDASDPIWKLRMRKSNAELELLRRSAEITGAARQRTFAELKPGMTDRQVLKRFFRHMLELGGDRPSFGFVAAGPPDPQIPLFGVPTGRPLEMGDLICLDGGCWVQDYSCDYDRLAVLGRPSTGQKDLYQRLRELNDKMLELYRPGVSRLKSTSAVLQSVAGSSFRIRDQLSGTEWACCSVNLPGSPPGMIRSLNQESSAAASPISCHRTVPWSGRTFWSSPRPVTSY